MTDSGRESGLITSLHNPTIRFARNLQRRRIRYRERAVVVEGVRSIQTAIDHQAHLRTVLVDARNAVNLPAGLIAALERVADAVLMVAPEPFASIVDTEQPQAIVAICDMPDRPPSGTASFVLALDGIRDPGNLGTLIRTALAAGVDSVALLPDCVDPYSPKVIRSSAGLVFALPISQFPDVPAAVSANFELLPSVVLADADGDIPWDQADWRRPTLMILGGEASGASQSTRTYADVRVRIPMPDGVDSLNVAAAGAVLMFERVRQRHSEH